MQLYSTVVQALSRLLDVKPEYDWMPLNSYVNPDLPDTVINKQPSSMIADLMGVMDHIITEGEEEAYQSEIQYRNAQSEFKRFLMSAEGWRNFEFISSILGMIALMALIIIAVFQSRIIESIILGSAVMDEYKFVNPSAPPVCVKSFSTTCSPGPNSIPTTHFTTKFGRQGCRRKTKACSTNNCLDYNDINYNYTIGNYLYNIQKVLLCILITKGMLPLVPIQHYTPRHRAHGYFHRGCKPGFGGSHVGAFHICHSPPFAIKDHRLPPRL